MKHYFALLIFLPLGLFANEWNPFPFNQKSIYSGTRHAHLMVADSVELVNGKTRYMINSKRSVLGVGECEEFLKYELENSFKWQKDAWTQREYEFLTNNDTIFFHDEFYLLKYPQLNQEWEITTPANEKLKISCTFIGTESFLGITDSVKVFKINGSKYQNFPFILSKSYGFIHFPDLNNFKTPTANINYYTLFGFENNNNTIGFQLPEFIDYFNYNVGDVIMWEVNSDNLNPLITNKIIFLRDSITNVQRSASNIVYSFNRESYDYKAHVKTNNLSVTWNKTEWGNILYPTTWWFSGQSWSSNPDDEKGIWGLKDHKIEIAGQDTILTFTSTNSSIFISENNDTCNLLTLLNFGYSFQFNSKMGLINSCNSNDYTTCTTLVGSIINGVYTGRTSLPLSINEHPSANRFRIYPVPAKEKLFFGNENHPNLNFRIFDYQGREVKSGNSNGPIEVSSLGAGIYFITLSSGQRTYRSKFVKE